MTNNRIALPGFIDWSMFFLFFKVMSKLVLELDPSLVTREWDDEW